MIFGNSANVGIGTSAPTAKLNVVGTFKLEDGTQAAGRVLTSDASGNAMWAAAAGGGGAGWGLTGNAGTLSNTNFIGTTDCQALDLRTDNVIKGRLTTKGQLEFLNTGS